MKKEMIKLKDILSEVDGTKAKNIKDYHNSKNKVKNFKQFVNERYDINTMPNNIVLLSLLYKDAGKFFLYDITQQKVVGFIVFDDVVDRVYSENDGFGAFLYETAMTYVFPKGLSMSREGSTSEEALVVWDKFNQRSDVKKERMYSSETTYKKEKLPLLNKYKNNPKKLQHILDLEDTKFFYSYGKNKLNNLIEIGNKYMQENGISESDLDNMEVNIDFSD